MRTIDEIRKEPNLFIDKEGYDGFSGRWFNKYDNKTYDFIFSYGGKWEHLSVSRSNKTPDWNIMCKMKEIFWKDDEVCVEYHPRKIDYINLHKNCLHIWKPINEEIPTPPIYFV